MITHIIPWKDNGSLDEIFLNKDSVATQSYEAMNIMLDLRGYDSCEMEEAKVKGHIRDFVVVNYKGRPLPFQIVHKYPNGNVVLHSWYILETRIFDKESNDYEKSDIRKYLNGEFLNNLDPEFVKMLKTADVPYLGKILKDKVFILSHEEIGYKDTNQYYKKNKHAICFDAFKDDAEEKTEESK